MNHGPDDHDEDKGDLLDDCGIYIDAGKFLCRDIGTEDCDWCPYRTMIGSDVPDGEDLL